MWKPNTNIAYINTGRRTTGMEGPDFIATLSPQQPVLVEGGWTKPCHGEVKKYIQVNQLQVSLER